MLDVPPPTELLQACRDGDVTRVRQLIAYGVDLQRPPRGQEGYLTVACRQGHLPVVKELVQAGAVPTQQDLILAVESGDVYLADRIADELFFAEVPFDFWSEDRPLLCKPGFLQQTSARMVEWMVEQGADPTQSDRFGRSAVQLVESDDVSDEVRAAVKKAAAD